MARPIELGLILEGKDAEEFWENEKNPKVTDLVLKKRGIAARVHESSYCLLLFWHLSTRTGTKTIR